MSHAYKRRRFGDIIEFDESSAVFARGKVDETKTISLATRPLMVIDETWS